MAMMRYQPQGLLRLQPGNPLAAGLRSAILPGVSRVYDAAGGAASPSGVKQIAGPGGMAGGFGPSGAGTSDRIVTKMAGAFPAVRSYYFRARRNGPGGGGSGLGRLFDKTNGSTGQMIYWSSTQNALAYSFYANSAEQITYVTNSGTTAAVGADFDFLVTHAQSGSSATVNVYVNGVLVTTNTFTASFNDAASTVLTIGNRASDNARNWDGLIECAYVWDRLLTADDAAALTRNRYQLFADPYEDDEIVVAAAPSGLTLTPTNAALSLAGYAPSISQASILAPSGASLALTGYAPSIGQAVTLSPAGASLALSGAAPSITQASGLYPPGATLALTGYAPSIIQPQTLTPGAAALSLTGYSPAVSQVVPVTLSPDGALLALAGYAPGLSQGAAANDASSSGGGDGGGGSVREVRAFAALLDRKPSRSQKKARRKQLEAEALELLPDLPEAERIAPLAARIVYEQEAKALAPLYANRPIAAMQPVVIPFDAHAALRELVEKLLAEALAQQKIAEDEENDVELLLFGT